MDKNKVGAIVEERLNQIAASSNNLSIWRPSYSESYAAAGSLIKQWLREDEFEVYEDAVGNIFGRYKGSESGTVLCGSHLDTVKNGGKYDGATGIITAILAARENFLRYGSPRKSIEVVALVEEEGSRFASSYIGSRSITGKLPVENLNETDSNGVTLCQAIKKAGFEGYTVNGLSKAVKNDLTAYLELHVEQGPYLENKGLQIGVVTNIVGIYSYEITIIGQQNHAGTTPMTMRLDPILAATDFISSMTAYCKKISPSATFTVGSITAAPGLSNVIARKVSFTVDFRDGIKDTMDTIESEIYRKADCFKSNGYVFEIKKQCDENPAVLSPYIIDVIENVVKEMNKPYTKMNSGAGHDAQIFSDKVPTGMIFIPSHNGISHSPDEFTSKEDLASGTEVMAKVLYNLAY